MLKTLLVTVFIVLNPQLGTPGEMMGQFSYTASFEECKDKNLPEMKKFIAMGSDVQHYMSMCVELTEAEQQDPINVAREIWLGMPRRE